MEAENPKEWLDLLRRRKDLTMETMAARLGISRMTLHRWEDPESKYIPNLAHAATLAQWAGTTVDEVARIFGAAPA